MGRRPTHRLRAPIRPPADLRSPTHAPASWQDWCLPAGRRRRPWSGRPRTRTSPRPSSRPTSRSPRVPRTGPATAQASTRPTPERSWSPTIPAGSLRFRLTNGRHLAPGDAEEVAIEAANVVEERPITLSTGRVHRLGVVHVASQPSAGISCSTPPFLVFASGTASCFQLFCTSSAAASTARLTLLSPERTADDAGAVTEGRLET